jgi:23S rRNA (cytidine1920-2'-O)/16S rRNA (cytidine1409-2'-O)-methyltransferase
VAAGLVAVAGQRAAKPATQVTRDAPITVTESGEPGYVSRGGRKLAGALEVFGGIRGVAPPGQQSVPQGLAIAGRACLDAGASTGGFTDVLLRAGAAHVVAADVGYGQLAWSLRTDPRVTVLDRVNVRTLDRDSVSGDWPVPGLVVADLSFISLTLVKPQFEVGKGRVGAGGVVRETADRSAAVRRVTEAAGQLGLGVQGVTASPLPGPAGNVEYFVWLRRGAAPLDEDQLQRAIEEGPS